MNKRAGSPVGERLSWADWRDGAGLARCLGSCAPQPAPAQGSSTAASFRGAIFWPGAAACSSSAVPVWSSVEQRCGVQATYYGLPSPAGLGACSFQYASPNAFTLPWATGTNFGVSAWLKSKCS